MTVQLADILFSLFILHKSQFFYCYFFFLIPFFISSHSTALCVFYLIFFFACTRQNFINPHLIALAMFLRLVSCFFAKRNMLVGIKFIPVYSMSIFSFFFFLPIFIYFYLFTRIHIKILCVIFFQNKKLLSNAIFLWRLFSC